MDVAPGTCLSMQGQRSEHVNKETGNRQAEAPMKFKIIVVPGTDTKLYEGDWVIIGVIGAFRSSSTQMYEHVTSIFQQSVPTVLQRPSSRGDARIGSLCISSVL